MMTGHDPTSAALPTTGTEVGPATPEVLWRVDEHDGSRICTWPTAAGYVETGFFPMADTDAVCVSCQAGCNIGCLFCVTGRQRSTGNLTTAEIVGQVTAASAFRRPGMRLDVGFQGMGEPLLNLDAVLSAAEVLSATYPGITMRLSTIGLLSHLPRLLDAASPLKLQISLHAANRATRERLIPASRGTDLPTLMTLANRYGIARGAPTLLNYVLLDGINDAPADADSIIDLVRGHDHLVVKLASYNPTGHLGYRRSPHADDFAQQLTQAGLTVKSFSSMGSGIGAACGHFRSRNPLSPSRKAHRDLR